MRLLNSRGMAQSASISRVNGFRRIMLITIFLLISSKDVMAGTYFVSPRGDDSYDGSKRTPFRTISRGAEAAMPGDTVLVGTGIYRERVAPPRSGKEGAPIVYMGEPGKRVFIKGSEIWNPKWEQYGAGIYYAVPEYSLFNDRSPEFPDNHNPFKVLLASNPRNRNGMREVARGMKGDSSLAYTLGQVFANGRQYKEVPFAQELAKESETWYYEGASGRIYINFGTLNPAEQKIEITTRRRIFAPYVRGLGYIIVQGFIMEHCGNQYPTHFWETPENAQRGALGIEAGHHWIIRKNVIRYAKTFAMDAGAVDLKDGYEMVRDNLIEENYILENGSAGILSCGSVNMIIRNNVVMYNNTLGFIGSYRWEQAGIKTHFLKNGYIHNNYVARNNLTYGIWLDNQFPDSRLSRNILLDNGSAGIFLEMSDYEYDRLFVDNNIILGNTENPLYIHDASGATMMHNIFANTPVHPIWGQAVFVRQVSARTKTYHHSFYNNLFLNNDEVYDIDYPSHRGGPQKMDYNVYDLLPSERKFLVNKYSDGPPPWDNAQFINLVHSELGALTPGIQMIDGESRALLTFDEWRTFWNYHELKNDAHSILQKGSSVNYNPENHELTLNIIFEPETIGSMNHKFIDRDFFGNPIPQNGKAKPGPFQELQTGENTFMIWRGLPVLERGELP